ncbi:MAG: BACON domain-containing protein [Blastocatellia bacterium]
MTKSNNSKSTGSPSPANRLRFAGVRSIFVFLCLLALGAGIALWRDRIPLVSAAVRAQDRKASPDGLWQEIDEASLQSRQAERQIVPQTYRTLRLNREALRELLSRAPMESTAAAKDALMEMTLPMPDGTFTRFRIEESPIMEPGLAAKFPEIKTYHGLGIDDPSAYVRFDWTPDGFHALVLRAGGAVQISPRAKGDLDDYLSYSLKDVPSPSDLKFQCGVLESRDANGFLKERSGAGAPAISFGTTIRTYKLAVAATKRWTSTYGGDTTAGAVMMIMTLMNQVDAVYRTELSVQFMLVDNNNLIVYPTTFTGTYPYTDNGGDNASGTTLNENQTNIDSVIGSGNYDIGHVFGVQQPSTQFAGLANVAVVCGGGKATGASMFTRGLTDNPFNIYVVAHEMGHQFGATHSYNASCGGNRNGSTSWEPDSGSTIMSYGSKNCQAGSSGLQENADPYFHGGNLTQIINHINGAGGCPRPTPSGNNPPNVSAGANYTIPQLTPFALTATGSDPDGDAVKFCWEELDPGPASLPNPPNPPNVDDGVSPLFRSFPASLNSTRTFPLLTYILNNANNPPPTIGGFVTGETLPATNRTMNFQVTARDNRADGAINTSSVQVTATTSSGPCQVTQPNTAVTWTGGTNQTVTWSVNNTNLPPVSCGAVDILLSIDGGISFPYALALNTPNDGSETITVFVGLVTFTARIKVQASDNIFFDISDANLTIIRGDCPPVPIPIGISTAGTLSTIDCSSQPRGAQYFADRYSFNASAGQQIAISLNSPDFDTYLYLIDPSGSVIAVDDDGGDGRNSRIPAGSGVFTLPSSGTYIIEATSTRAQAVGGYTLNLGGCAYSIFPMSQSFGPSSGTGSVSVTTETGCAWTATSNAAWITITSGSSGSGSGTVNHSVAANTGPARTGTMTIAGRTFTVTQSGANCTFTISPTSQTFVAAAGNGAVSVTAAAACAWTAVSNATWITVTSGSSGSGSGTVNYTVAANTGPQRTGTMTIAGQTFTVTQNSGCTFTISPTTQTFAAGGGNGTVSVTTAAGCAWTATSNAAWITITGGTPGSGNGTLNYTVAANTGQQRSDTMTIAGRTLTVTQNANCTATISPTSQTFGGGGGSGFVSVNVFVGCAWTATSNAAWITVTGGSPGSGVGTVSYTVAANPSTSQRTGTMTIAGQTFTVTESGANCTYTLNPNTAQNYGAAGGSGTVNVTAPAGCAWTAVSNASWITITSGSSGSGNGTVNYTVAANIGPPRSGTMTIAGFTSGVGQTSGCAYSISPASQHFSGAGGTGTFNITTSTGCTWTASTQNTWITGAPPGFGSGSGTVSYTVATNNGSARSGIITISGNGSPVNFPVTQDAAGSTGGLQFYPLAHPVRLLETRAGQSGCDAPGARIPGGTSRTQTAAGRSCDGLAIPASAKAITGNITTVQSGGGYLTLYPSDAAQPTVANSNYNPNEILNNVFTVGLGAGDGAFKIFVTSNTDVVVDVTGYYAPPGTGGLYFHPLPRPVRLLETRTGFPGCYAPGAPLPGNVDTTQQATGGCGGLTIPAAAKAITGNATTVNPQGPGSQYFTLFPADASRPNVASSNYLPGQIMNAPFTVRLSPGGAFKIYPATQTDLVIDVLGYYSTEVTDVNGTGLLFYPLAQPGRLLDTRLGFSGCYTPGAALAASSTRTQPARGVCAIPTNTAGIIGNATVVSPAGGGYLTFWPSDAAQPTVAASNYTTGQVFNRHFIVGLGSADGAFNIFTSATTHLVIDMSGYFAP